MSSQSKNASYFKSQTKSCRISYQQATIHEINKKNFTTSVLVEMRASLNSTTRSINELEAIQKLNRIVISQNANYSRSSTKSSSLE